MIIEQTIYEYLRENVDLPVYMTVPNLAKVKAFYNMIDLDRVTKVSLNSDYNYTDTTTKHYRYQAVFNVTHY